MQMEAPAPAGWNPGGCQVSIKARSLLTCPQTALPVSRGASCSANGSASRPVTRSQGRCGCGGSSPEALSPLTSAHVLPAATWHLRPGAAAPSALDCVGPCRSWALLLSQRHPPLHPRAQPQPPRTRCPALEPHLGGVGPSPPAPQQEAGSLPPWPQHRVQAARTRSSLPVTRKPHPLSWDAFAVAQERMTVVSNYA